MCNVPSGAEAYGALYAAKSSDGVSFKLFALDIERLAGSGASGWPLIIFYRDVLVLRRMPSGLA